MLSRTDDFEQQVAGARDMLFRIAMSMCRDETRADDLVQDAMLRALINKHLFEPGTNLHAWLVTILTNRLRSSFRKRREAEDPDDQMANVLPAPDNPLRRLEAAEILQQVMKLPDQFRRPMLLIADGATYEEAAFEMREHVGTIKSRVNRAKAMIGIKS